MTSMHVHVHPYTGEVIPRRARPLPVEPKEITADDIERAWFAVGTANAAKRAVVVINSTGRLGVLNHGEACAASPKIRVVGVYANDVDLALLTEDVRWAEQQARNEIAQMRNIAGGIEG